MLVEVEINCGITFWDSAVFGVLCSTVDGYGAWVYLYLSFESRTQCCTNITFFLWLDRPEGLSTFIVISSRDGRDKKIGDREMFKE